ncbi:YihY/virulence factor BrkB family protein [Bradyrhizobium sp. OAE829]|uniref:YihY/virulence factor BrkB family protein n=1 Tax=Bradyrhizobium sp. OAE829 TaxID=2663807 RepID=UPI0019DBE971
MAMVPNNARHSAGSGREERSTRLDKWTVISGAVVLMAATLTAVLAPEGRRPLPTEDERNPLRERSRDTAPREAATEVQDQNDRGRLASSPSEIPARGWKDILLRVYSNISEHRVLALAAGMTYYSLLAIFPAIAALVAVYGLFADPTAITRHLDQVSGILPGGAVDVARDQLTRVASKGSGTLGATFVIGLVVSLWSANAAMKSLFDTLNIVYGETEKRGFLKLNVVSLSFTFAGIVFVLTALGAVVVIPVVLNFIGLSNFADLMLRLARWPAMFIAVALALALIYRYGPSREAPQWRWITWGSAAAAVFWLVGSALFSWYAASFGKFNETYGSLGAVIGFMTWLWISAIVILLGAELDAEMEHQTARDTTTGSSKPMGTRGARMADTVGSAHSMI